MSWLNESGSEPGSGFSAFDNMTEFDPEDNLTLSCAARSIQGSVQQPYPDIINIIVRVCQSIFLLLIGLSGLFLNVLLVVLVAKYKKLQTLEFGVATQIVVCGIKSSLIRFLNMINSIANRWLFGVHMCGIVGAITSANYMARTQILCIFVINRFLVVFLPFGYPKYQKAIVIALSFASWLIALLVGIILYTFDCYDFHPGSWSCSLGSACSQNCALLGIIPTTLVVAPSTIIPVFLYVILFIKAKKAKKALVPAAEKQDYDWKATITFFLMFICTFALTLPNAIIAFVISIIYDEENPPLGAYLLLTLATIVPGLLAALDAIVILRNRDVRDIVEEIKEKIVLKWFKQ